jgi:hypothetical protein
LIGTPVELQVGAKAVTVGKTAAPTVVKEHVKGMTGVPDADVAGAPTVIVIVALAGKGGVVTANCAVKVAAL